jgi:hypothetical protein
MVTPQEADLGVGIIVAFESPLTATTSGNNNPMVEPAFSGG